MSHHASSDSEFPGDAKQQMGERLNELAKQLRAGATQQFPRGSIHRTDEGELCMGVTVQNNTVIIAFGKPVAWIGMSRVEAIEMAELLKKRASEL